MGLAGADSLSIYLPSDWPFRRIEEGDGISVACTQCREIIASGPRQSYFVTNVTIRNQHLRHNYTAAIKKFGKRWIGWIEEVPAANCQDATKQELIESLRVTLREALEFIKREVH